MLHKTLSFILFKAFLTIFRITFIICSENLQWINDAITSVQTNGLATQCMNQRFKLSCDIKSSNIILSSFIIHESLFQGSGFPSSHLPYYNSIIKTSQFIFMEQIE